MNDAEFLQFNIRDINLKFKTRPGVFSQKGLDKGSRLLMENIQIPEGSLVADLGCGSGVIGMFAAKLDSGGHVHLLDANLRNINLARENVEFNRLKNAEVFLSDLFSGVENRTYQIILSNPPQHLGNDFLLEIADECFRHLKDNGVVYWVIQSNIKKVAQRIMENTFRNCEMVDRNFEYVILKSTKS